MVSSLPWAPFPIPFKIFLSQPPRLGLFSQESPVSQDQVRTASLYDMIPGNRPARSQQNWKGHFESGLETFVDVETDSSVSMFLEYAQQQKNGQKVATTCEM